MELIQKIGFLADRMSVNLELPTAEGLQKTLHAAMGAAIISLLSAVGCLIFEIVRYSHG